MYNLQTLLNDLNFCSNLGKLTDTNYFKLDFIIYKTGTLLLTSCDCYKKLSENNVDKMLASGGRGTEEVGALKCLFLAHTRNKDMKEGYEKHLKYS